MASRAADFRRFDHCLGDTHFEGSPDNRPIRSHRNRAPQGHAVLVFKVEVSERDIPLARRSDPADIAVEDRVREPLVVQESGDRPKRNGKPVTSNVEAMELRNVDGQVTKPVPVPG